MRSTNLFLKKEKLKAEHERNLVEIRAKQMEEALKKLNTGPAASDKENVMNQSGNPDFSRLHSNSNQSYGAPQ